MIASWALFPLVALLAFLGSALLVEWVAGWSCDGGLLPALG